MKYLLTLQYKLRMNCNLIRISLEMAELKLSRINL